MTERVSVSFSRWSRDVFAPEIEAYVRILLERVLPIFDDVDGEADRAAQEVLASPSWGAYSYEDALEAAHDRSIESALQFMELRSVFLTMGAAGLFHLFEKQVYKHFNTELRYWFTAITEWNDIEEIIKKLIGPIDEDGARTKLQARFSDADLYELRLVANAIKHGEGRSYSQLMKMGALVVNENRLQNDWTVGTHSILRVNIAMLPEDIERYRDAILRFWRIDGNFSAPLTAFHT